MKLYISIVVTVLSFSSSAWAQGALEQNIENAVRVYVTQQARLRGADSVLVEIRSLPLIPSSLAEHVSVHVAEGSFRTFKNHCTVPVELEREHRVIYRLHVSVRIRLFGPVVYSLQQLERHCIPSGGDVLVRYTETTTLSDDILRTPLAWTGKRTTRIIAAGSVLTQSMFEPIPVIATDDLVTLIARTGTIQVSTQAIAKDSGNLGSVITVQKVGSHEKLRARVVNEHTVQLEID